MARDLLVLLLTCASVAMVSGQEERRRGAASPEELVKSFVQAMRDGDERAMEALEPDVARLHQKVKVIAERLDQTLVLEKEWQKELNQRFTGKKDDRFGRPVDLAKPQKASPLVKVIPGYSAEIIEKKAMEKGTVELVLDVRESKQSEKQRVTWRAIETNNGWVLSVPALKKTAQLYEKTMMLMAGSEESLAAKRQALADLKQGKYANYEDAETAWKRAGQKTAKLQIAGNEEFTLPGPKLPGGDSESRPRIEFRLADQLEARGFEAMKLPGSTETIYVARDVSLSHVDIEKVTEHPSDRSTITITFNAACQAKLKQILDKPDVRLIAVLVNGKLVAAPAIDNKLTQRLIIKGVDGSMFLRSMAK